jgi:protein subunit release factor B
MISANKWQQLTARMAELGILDADLTEKFIIGSGSGGQNLHKTSSCVHLKHLPTGIEIKCQETRYRDDNRYHARARLCDKIENLVLQKQSKLQQAIAKIRHQKQRRTRKAKQKMLATKHERSATKALRKPPKSEE